MVIVSYAYVLMCSTRILSKVFIECSTKANLVMVFGEITTKAKLDYVKIVRDTLEYIGYDDEEHGKDKVVYHYIVLSCFTAIDYRTCQTLVAIHTQAPDIAQKVHEGKADEDIGAGDQVIHLSKPPNIHNYYM